FSSPVRLPWRGRMDNNGSRPTLAWTSSPLFLALCPSPEGERSQETRCTNILDRMGNAIQKYPSEGRNFLAGPRIATRMRTHADSLSLLSRSAPLLVTDTDWHETGRASGVLPADSPMIQAVIASMGGHAAGPRHSA